MYTQMSYIRAYAVPYCVHSDKFEKITGAARAHNPGSIRIEFGSCSCSSRASIQDRFRILRIEFEPCMAKFWLA